MKSQNIRHQNIPEGLKIISGLSVWSVQVILVLVSVPSGHSGFYPKWLLHVIVTITHVDYGHQQQYSFLFLEFHLKGECIFGAMLYLHGQICMVDRS